MENEEFDYNLCIKEVVGNMVENPCQENFMHVIAEMVLRINAEATVPTPMQKVTYIVLGLDPDAQLKDAIPRDTEEENKIAVFTDENGTNWLLLFSTFDELQDLQYEHRIDYVPIRDIFEKALEDETIEGILINPYSDSYALRKDVIGFVLEHVGDCFPPES